MTSVAVVIPQPLQQKFLFHKCNSDFSHSEDHVFLEYLLDSLSFIGTLVQGGYVYGEENVIGIHQTTHQTSQTNHHHSNPPLNPLGGYVLPSLSLLGTLGQRFNTVALALQVWHKDFASAYTNTQPVVCPQPHYQPLPANNQPTAIAEPQRTPNSQPVVPCSPLLQPVIQRTPGSQPVQPCTPQPIQPNPAPVQPSPVLGQLLPQPTPSPVQPLPTPAPVQPLQQPTPSPDLHNRRMSTRPCPASKKPLTERERHLLRSSSESSRSGPVERDTARSSPRVRSGEGRVTRGTLKIEPMSPSREEGGVSSGSREPAAIRSNDVTANSETRSNTPGTVNSTRKQPQIVLIRASPNPKSISIPNHPVGRVIPVAPRMTDPPLFPESRAVVAYPVNTSNYTAPNQKIRKIAPKPNGVNRQQVPTPAVSPPQQRLKKSQSTEGPSNQQLQPSEPDQNYTVDEESSTPMVYKCNQCKMKFNNGKVLSRHYAVLAISEDFEIDGHGSAKKRPDGLLSCSYCSSGKTFKTSRALMKHQMYKCTHLEFTELRTRSTSERIKGYKRAMNDVMVMKEKFPFLSFNKDHGEIRATCKKCDKSFSLPQSATKDAGGEWSVARKKLLKHALKERKGNGPQPEEPDTETRSDPEPKMNQLTKLRKSLKMTTTCQTCHLQFSNGLLLSRHYGVVAVSEDFEVDGHSFVNESSGAFYCSYCTGVSFSSGQAVMQHQMFTCPRMSELRAMSPMDSEITSKKRTVKEIIVLKQKFPFLFFVKEQSEISVKCTTCREGFSLPLHANNNRGSDWKVAVRALFTHALRHQPDVTPTTRNDNAVSTSSSSTTSSVATTSSNSKGKVKAPRLTTVPRGRGRPKKHKMAMLSKPIKGKSCHTCDMTFSNKQILSRHYGVIAMSEDFEIEGHTFLNPKGFFCSFCSKTGTGAFASSKEVMHHQMFSCSELTSLRTSDSSDFVGRKEATKIISELKNKYPFFAFHKSRGQIRVDCGSCDKTVNMLPQSTNASEEWAKGISELKEHAKESHGELKEHAKESHSELKEHARESHNGLKDYAQESHSAPEDHSQVVEVVPLDPGQPPLVPISSPATAAFNSPSTTAVVGTEKAGKTQKRQLPIGSSLGYTKGGRWGRFSCKICDYKSNGGASMGRHFGTIAVSEDFQLEGHAYVKGDRPGYTCRYCDGLVFKTAEEVMRHQSFVCAQLTEMRTADPDDFFGRKEAIKEAAEMKKNYPFLTFQKELKGILVECTLCGEKMDLPLSTKEGKKWNYLTKFVVVPHAAKHRDSSGKKALDNRPESPSASVGVGNIPAAEVQGYKRRRVADIFAENSLNRGAFARSEPSPVDLPECSICKVVFSDKVTLNMHYGITQISVDFDTKTHNCISRSKADEQFNFPSYPCSYCKKDQVSSKDLLLHQMEKCPQFPFGRENEENGNDNVILVVGRDVTNTPSTRDTLPKNKENSVEDEVEILQDPEEVTSPADQTEVFEEIADDTPQEGDGVSKKALEIVNSLDVDEPNNPITVMEEGYSRVDSGSKIAAVNPMPVVGEKVATSSSAGGNYQPSTNQRTVTQSSVAVVHQTAITPTTVTHSSPVDPAVSVIHPPPPSQTTPGVESGSSSLPTQSSGSVTSCLPAAPETSSLPSHTAPETPYLPSQPVPETPYLPSQPAPEIPCLPIQPVPEIPCLPSQPVPSSARPETPDSLPPPPLE
eukprot:sb/3479451/